MGADLPAPAPEDWHTTAELEPRVRRRPGTLRKALSAGELHGHFVGNRWLCKGTVADAWLSQLDRPAQVRICGCTSMSPAPERRRPSPPPATQGVPPAAPHRDISPRPLSAPTLAPHPFDPSRVREVLEGRSQLRSVQQVVATYRARYVLPGDRGEEALVIEVLLANGGYIATARSMSAPDRWCCSAKPHRDVRAAVSALELEALDRSSA